MLLWEIHQDVPGIIHAIVLCRWHISSKIYSISKHEFNLSHETSLTSRVVKVAQHMINVLTQIRISKHDCYDQPWQIANGPKGCIIINIELLRHFFEVANWQKIH